MEGDGTDVVHVHEREAAGVVGMDHLVGFDQHHLGVLRRFAGFGDDHRARDRRMRPGGGREGEADGERTGPPEAALERRETGKERSPRHGGTSWGSWVRRNRTFRGRRRGRTVPDLDCRPSGGRRAGGRRSLGRLRGGERNHPGAVLRLVPRERQLRPALESGDSGLRDLADPAGVVRLVLVCVRRDRQRGGQHQGRHGPCRHESRPEADVLHRGGTCNRRCYHRESERHVRERRNYQPR